MANLKRLASISAELRAERAKLADQLRHLDQALGFLGLLRNPNGGSSNTTRRPVRSVADLGSDFPSQLDLTCSGRLRTLKELERHYVHEVLRREGGHVGSAARKLGIPRSSLYHKLKQYQKRLA